MSPKADAHHMAICANVSVENTHPNLPEWAAVVFVLNGEELLLSLPVAGGTRTGNATAVINVQPGTKSLTIKASATMIQMAPTGVATVTVTLKPPVNALTMIKCPDCCNPRSSVKKGTPDTVQEPYDELMVAVNTMCTNLMASPHKESLTGPAIKAIAYGRHNALLKTNREYRALPKPERARMVLAHSAPWIARWIIAWKTVITELSSWLAVNRFEPLPQTTVDNIAERAILTHLREARTVSRSGIDLHRTVQSAVVMATQFMLWWMSCDVLAAAARDTQVVVRVPVARNGTKPMAIQVSKDGRPFWESQGSQIDVFDHTAAGNTVTPRPPPQLSRRAAGALADHA